MKGIKKLIFILQTFVILITASPRQSEESGCTDGSREGFQNDLYPNIAACVGGWSGHVENASHLCSDGWRVCTYEDTEALTSMRWEDATSLGGCFAYNAAQDGGRCRPCTDLTHQDDMAGIGGSCPHQVYGKPSCISGGVIAASCCDDTKLNKACHYRSGSMSGVMCCRLPGVKPHIIVKPEEFNHVTTGVTFVLSCQAMGTPTPVVQWYKNKELLPNNISRIAVFESGYLLISGAQPSDSGDYRCYAKNRIGEDVALSRIVVTGHGSGCADGITDGLHQFEDIQACRGEWWGHIKRAKNLCARGWRVCSSRQGHLLKLLTWSDVTSLDGCYAYNAANILNRCQRCHRGDMAGVGKGCSLIRRTHKSCLSEGRIDVYKGKLDPGCSYQPGLTTGILCCRRNTQPRNSWWKPPKCVPKCQNGGKCVSSNRCRCTEGYKGAWCQNPICPKGCRIPNSYCAKPGICQCKPGFVGKKCRRRSLQCKKKCLNGGRCFGGRCKCPKSHWGDSCQHAAQRKPLSDLNRTEK